MKKQILKSAIALIAIIFVVTACKKKEDDAVTPASETCKISNLKSRESGDSSVFFYDSQGRVSKIENYDATGAKTYNETYTYNGNKITYATDDEDDYISDFYLNASGLVTYAATRREITSSKYYDTIFYTYNADGYMIKEIGKYTRIDNSTTSNSSDTAWYAYTDGNQTTKTVKATTGVTVVFTNVYTSLTTKYDILSGIELFNPGALGKPNKNLLGSVGNNLNSDTSDFTYELNGDGYITRITASYKNGSATDVFKTHLYYSCK